MIAQAYTASPVYKSHNPYPADILTILTNGRMWGRCASTQESLPPNMPGTRTGRIQPRNRAENWIPPPQRLAAPGESVPHVALVDSLHRIENCMAEMAYVHAINSRNPRVHRIDDIHAARPWVEYCKLKLILILRPCSKCVNVQTLNINWQDPGRSLDVYIDRT